MHLIDVLVWRRIDGIRVCERIEWAGREGCITAVLDEMLVIVCVNNILY